MLHKLPGIIAGCQEAVKKGQYIFDLELGFQRYVKESITRPVDCLMSDGRMLPTTDGQQQHMK